MEIHGLYNGFANIFLMFGADIPTGLFGGLLTAFAIWTALFILQGIGLYAMGKRRNMKACFTAFIPFVNIWFMGKLAGTCEFFGQKIKRTGVYAMILQIITTLFGATIIAAEIYLYTTHGAPQMSEQFVPYWTGLTGFSLGVERFYDLGGYIYSICQLVYEIFMLVLIMGILRRYVPKNYMILSFLTLFVPLSRFIIIFVIRKRKAIDYEAYIRARREAYMRSRQQYQNPYGYPNPYGNPYANPYTPPQNSTQNSTQPAEEPFAEFNGESQTKETEKSKENKPTDDEFFE
ncbi:MAG: hypothetical protein J6A63_01380 [Clostridia bacterium]|nr:hypothetical protein [Clostridia bacterium]